MTRRRGIGPTTPSVRSLSVADIRVLLGLRIEELRTSLSLTRAELAKRADIDERQVANYELYGAWPKPETLVELVKGLEVEIHDVFDFTDTRRRLQASLQQRLANRGHRSDRGLTRRPRS